jgi:hypothetical protein
VSRSQVRRPVCDEHPARAATATATCAPGDWTRADATRMAQKRREIHSGKYVVLKGTFTSTFSLTLGRPSVVFVRALLE